MRCMSCGADIPPAFVHSISSNICGGCGGPIMNEATIELLKELTDAITRMPHDPAGVAGWLLSNYRFQKMGAAQPVEKFHHKGGGPSGDFDSSGLRIAPNYSDFVKRNDATQYVNRSYELAAKFGSAKEGKMAELASMIQSVSDPYEDNTSTKDEDAPPDAEEQKSYLELKQAGFDPFAAAPSAGAGMADLYQAINPKDVAKLLKSQDVEAPLEAELELAQTEKGRAILQMNQIKKLKAQDAISGGGGGSFRRSG